MLRITITSLTAAGLSLLLFAGPAGADDAGTTSTTPTTTAPTPSSLLGSTRAFWAAGAALVIGLIAIGLVLLFLYGDRGRSFVELDTLIRQGKSGTIDDEGALANAAAAQAPASLAAGSPSTEIQIEGPDSLVVGQPMNYLAIGPNNDSATWTVQGEATLSTSTGPTVRVNAQGAGALRISVATPGGPTVSKSVTVAQPASQGSWSVPFLGSGYGSVVIALSVASVTAALGLTSVINGEAVATILGALVSYSIARAAAASSDGPTGSNPASGSAGAQASSG